jgi:hypothetical protein
MATVTITLSDEADGLKFDGKSSDPLALCRSNVIAEYVARNFERIHNEALRWNIERTKKVAKLLQEKEREGAEVLTFGKPE